MRLTTKGRYAVTAMLDLSINSTNGPVNLGDISRRQDISLSYLEQLFAKLRRRKLVSSVRGPGGGYRLGRSDKDIHVAEIDRKSTRLNSSHVKISYAVFCLKKKIQKDRPD